MTKRILVVEDQEDNRRILRDLLVHAGYEVFEVGDGEGALPHEVAADVGVAEPGGEGGGVLRLHAAEVQSLADQEGVAQRRGLRGATHSLLRE